MEGFASYAFNKSHAAAYATLAYQTAWLKKYYCKEFICALLNNRINKIDEITKYIIYLKDKGMKVFPHDINKSKTVFSVENDGILFGLSALKGSGQAAIDDVIKERTEHGPFADFPDFLMRCAGLVNKRIIEGLILAGAFDRMGVPRSQLYAVYDELYTRAAAINKQKSSAQMSLFGDIIAEEKLEVTYPNIPEFELMDKLSKEKLVLGVYVSGHPFEKYMSAFNDCNFNCSYFSDYMEDEDGNRTYNRITDGMQVTMGGIISNMRRTVTKSTGSPMAFITVEDIYGSVECVAFPAIFERIKAVLAVDKIVRLRGKLDLSKDDEPSIILDDVSEFDSTVYDKKISGSTAAARKKAILWLNASRMTDDEFNELVAMLANYEGETDCALVRGGKKYKLSHGINYCRGLLAELFSFLLEEEIKYVG